jgi:hypothetical protein
LLVAGRFHVDYKTAIPTLLQQYRPHLRIQTITAMPIAATHTVSLHDLRQQHLADYVWFTRPVLHEQQ